MGVSDVRGLLAACTAQLYSAAPVLPMQVALASSLPVLAAAGRSGSAHTPVRCWMALDCRPGTGRILPLATKIVTSLVPGCTSASGDLPRLQHQRQYLTPARALQRAQAHLHRQVNGHGALRVQPGEGKIA